MGPITYREAAEYYRQAAALVPAEAETQRAEYLNLQGYALYEAGDYRHAQEPATQALAIPSKAGTRRPSCSISARLPSGNRPSGSIIPTWP